MAQLEVRDRRESAPLVVGHRSIPWGGFVLSLPPIYAVCLCLLNRHPSHPVPPPPLDLLVPQRYECRDHVSVYDTATWTQQRHFPVSTEDAAELSWSPDGGYLALVDGPLSYRVVVHAADGRYTLQHFNQITHSVLHTVLASLIPQCSNSLFTLKP